jgi:hypothetical protein
MILVILKIASTLMLLLKIRAIVAPVAGKIIQM